MSYSEKQIAQMRRNAADAKKKASGKGDFWAPVVGRNIIRILPPWEGAELFYREAAIHYGLGADGKQSVPCIAPDERCPICAEADRLFRTKDPDDAEVAKRIRAKTRYYTNIIDRANESAGPQVYAFGPTVLGQLLNIILDPDPDWEMSTSEITHPKKGYDIKVKRVGEKLETEYTVTPAKEASPLGNSEWLDAILDLDEAAFLKLKTVKEMKALLSGEPMDEDNAEPTPKKSKKDDDEEDDPKPKKSKKDDDEEDDPKPKKSKKDEDDEEDDPKPKKKARAVEDDDEDEPKSKKSKKDADDEEDDPKPKKSKKDEDDEEDDPKPKKKRVVDDDEEDEIERELREIMNAGKKKGKK